MWKVIHRRPSAWKIKEDADWVNVQIRSYHDPERIRTQELRLACTSKVPHLC